MKKTFTVSLTSFLFLSVSSVTAYTVASFNIGEAWLLLLIGLVVLALSGAVAAFAAEKIPLNVACFFVSAIALGFCIRAWYVFRGFNNSLPLMLLVSLVATAYIWVFYFLSRIPLFNGHPKAFIVIYLVLTLVVYIIVVFTTKTTYVSTFGYYILIESAFIIAMSTSVNGPADLIRKLTLGSYTVFAAAVFIAIALALSLLGGDCDCDCDAECCCLDACDIDLGSVKSKKKKK